MSMISSQCDELRERATTLRQGRWSDGEDDATLMEQAADTIWELRCKLAGVVDQSDEIERLKAENVELRELVHKYGEYTSQDHCEGCFCKSRCNDGDVDECWQLTEIRELARKLQVEVDA